MFWKKSIAQQMQPVLLQVDYDMVFRDGVVGTNLSSNRMIEAKHASSVVSMLNFLDRLSNYADNYGREDSRDYSDWTQALLRELYNAKAGDVLDALTTSQLRGVLAVNGKHSISEKEFQSFFDEQGCITDAFEQICRDVLRVGSVGAVSGRVYVDSRFYNEQFEKRAHNISLELTMEEHGVYGLKEPKHSY